jgi:hypothetical protein
LSKASWQSAAEKMSLESVRDTVTAPDTPPPDAARDYFNVTQAIKKLAKVEHGDVLFTDDDQFLSVFQSHLTAQAVAEKELAEVTAGFEVQFDEKDLAGWIKSFFTWYRSIRKHPANKPPDDINELDDSFNVAILGDWGSGLYGAPICARSIETSNDDWQVLLHLGDVYYSGTETEIGQRFLKFWPNRPEARNRALNSNHEMYSGGNGYFDITLNTFRQPSSYFAMANDRWMLIGLDSAYDAQNSFALSRLGDAQLTWLKGVVAQAGNRRIVFFSHHQPVSLLDAGNASPPLVDQLSFVLGSGKVAAWYWGHEHRCVLYDPNPAWGNMFGRCVGHSGFPYFADKNLENAPMVENTFRKLPMMPSCPGGLVLVGENPYVPGHEKEYGPNGYMTLHVDGDTLTEVVRAPDGSKLLERSYQ